MLMKIICFDELSDLQPKLELEKVRTMSEEERKKYIELYCAYLDLLIQYLCKKIDLISYETKLKNSGLNFKEVEENKMDIYQYLSSDYLKYFYLRNTLHINRLNKLDYEVLLNKLERNDMTLDEEAEKLIDRTYGNIIREEEGTTISYGPNSSSFFVLNGNLVIGFRYDEFADLGLSDEEWDEQHDKQIPFLLNCLAEVENNANEKLDIPTNIVQYSEFSVKERNLNKEDAKSR